MKHAAILYTCVGLMGAAALAGFIDYSNASKSGVMSSLYNDETQTTGSTLLPKKDIEIDDYSRGPLEERYVAQEEEQIKADDPKPKKKEKKFIPPPPPPAPEAPPAPDVKVGDIPPPPPPKIEEPPVMVVAPTPAEEVKEIPASPAPPLVLEESKEIRWESFSRAPLKPKKITKRNKRNQ